MTIATKTNLSCALLVIIACGAVSLTILVGSEEMGRLASGVFHDHERPSLEDALPLISTAALLVVCAIALTFMSYLKRRTVLPMERAADFAGAWGSDFHEAGDAGHIDTASGHGPWPEGLLMFTRLMQRL